MRLHPHGSPAEPAPDEAVLLSSRFPATLPKVGDNFDSLVSYLTGEPEVSIVIALGLEHRAIM